MDSEKKSGSVLTIGVAWLWGVAVIVPFIVTWIPMNLSALESAVYGFTRYGDLFAHGKSIAFTLAFVTGAVGLVVHRFWKGRIQGPKVLGLAGVLGGFLLLSAVLSPWFPVPLTGIPERYESVWVQLGYLVLMLSAARYAAGIRKQAVILNGLKLQAVLMGLLCCGQYYGFNLLNWHPVKVWIVGSRLASVEEIALVTDRVYGTLGNPGNLAQYCAFLLPLLLGHLMMQDKPRPWEAVPAACCTFMAVACGSGAAILGAGFGVLVLLAVLVERGIALEPRRLLMPLVAGALIALPRVGRILELENAALLMIFVGLALLLVTQGHRFSSAVWRYAPTGLAVLMLLASALFVLAPGTDKNDFIKSIQLSQGTLAVETAEGAHQVRFQDGAILFSKPTGEPIDTKLSNSLFTSGDSGLDRMNYGLETQAGKTVLVSYRTGFRYLLEDTGLKMLNRAGMPTDIQAVEHFGFEGREDWFSCRGYIWSRSIPLLLEHPWLGVGADTFVFAFPQDDFAEKFNVFGTPYILIDKPHSFYLQYWIQFGILAFLLLLAIITGAFWNGMIRIKTSGARHLLPWIAGLGGFLAAAVFNDSLTGTTLFLWLGTGILLSED